MTDFGTEPRKIIHRNAVDTEVAAGHRVDTKTDEERVYRLIIAAENGMTIKEAARRMGKTPNQISGRFTALRDKWMIMDSGNRREQSRVMVKYVEPYPDERQERLL